jgi:hypothetical protein
MPDCMGDDCSPLRNQCAAHLGTQHRLQLQPQAAPALGSGLGSRLEALQRAGSMGGLEFGLWLGDYWGQSDMRQGPVVLV